jgi:hypothetical protein
MASFPWPIALYIAIIGSTLLKSSGVFVILQASLTDLFPYNSSFMAYTTDPSSARLSQMPDWNSGFVRKARNRWTKQVLTRYFHQGLVIEQVSVRSGARHASSSSITKLSALSADTKRKYGDPVLYSQMQLQLPLAILYIDPRALVQKLCVYILVCWIMSLYNAVDDVYSFLPQCYISIEKRFYRLCLHLC